MTILIETAHDRRIKVHLPLLTVTDTETDEKIHIHLNEEQRRTLAEALVPYDRGGITVDPSAVASGRVAIAEHARDAAVARAEQAERTLRTETERAFKAGCAWERTSAPAVSRADIEKAILPHILYPANGTQDLINDVHALVSGDDPAVYVVRESDLPEAYRGDRVLFNGERVRHWWTRDGDWIADEDASADQVRREGMRHLVKAARHEAVARAIEAEAVVDPVEAKAREIATMAYPEDGFAGAFDVADKDAKAAYRRIARHLVWQETGQ